MNPGYVITEFRVVKEIRVYANLYYKDGDGDWRIREFFLDGTLCLKLADDKRAAVSEITRDGYLKEVYVGLVRHGEQPLFATPATLVEVITREVQAAMDAREVAQ